MTTHIHATFLPLVDPDVSIAFWRDAMGFEVRNDVGYGDLRWITVGPSGQPDVNIVLYPLDGDPTISESEKQVVNELMAKGSFASIVLGTADVDAEFARLEATSAEVVQEPTDQPYGVRDCAFRDPTGTMIRIQQIEG